MKYNIALVVFMYHLLFFIACCEVKDTNHIVSQQKDTTINESERYLIDRIESLQTELNESRSLNNNFLLSFASWMVAALSFLLAFSVNWLGFFNRKKIKDATMNLEKTKEENLKLIRTEIRKLEKSKLELKKQFEQFEHNSREIVEIDKKVAGNQAYIQQGLESNFNIFYRYLSRTNDNDFLNLLFEKRAIINLYSPDNNARFAGITTLLEKGKKSSIIHLNKIILDSKETVENKILATKAISKINSRIIK